MTHDPRPTTPPRIIHLASGREWRGGQMQALLLARGLAAQSEVETIVVTGRDTELQRRLEDAKVTTDAVRWGPGLDLRVFWHLVRVMRRGGVIHAHDSHAHALADAAALFTRVPLVVTRRLSTPVRSPRRLRRASAVIAISEAVRQEVHQAGVDDARIHLVPDAIDLDAAAREVPWPENVPHFGMDLPLIVCVAALSPEKGVNILIEAAAILKSHHLRARWVVLGEGRERALLEAQRAALGVTAEVFLPGAVADPIAALGQATIAVQPSLSEGFGSAVLLAMARGVPVVASAAGGLPEVLREGGGILVPVGSATALSAGVARLLHDPGERQRHGTEGRIAVRRYGVERLVERTLDVYRSVTHLQGEA